MTNLEETRYTYFKYNANKHTYQSKDECIIRLFKIEDISNRVIFEDQSIDDTQFYPFCRLQIVVKPFVHLINLMNKPITLY